MNMGKKIVAAAIESGATLAGIASIKALKTSSSHLIYTQLGDYAGIGTVNDAETLPPERLFDWPDAAKSVLVIALSHPENQPELDWWDGRGTPGNRQLIQIMKLVRRRIEDELQVRTRLLHYYVQKGGVFLKDAAVLAGLGCIGKSNLLVTPDYGPRVRLRALFLDAEVEPTGPMGFDPCEDCKVYCRRVCPEKAMVGKAAVLESIRDVVNLPGGDGAFDRDICNIRMEKDIFESGQNGSGVQAPVKYCRKCELVCPVGK